MNIPGNPTLYRKTWGLQGYISFFYLTQKHRLWVLDEAVLTNTNDLYILSRTQENITDYQLKNNIHKAMKASIISDRYVMVICDHLVTPSQRVF